MDIPAMDKLLQIKFLPQIQNVLIEIIASKIQIDIIDFNKRSS